MKILYIAPKGTKIGFIENVDPSELITYDMESIFDSISKGIYTEFDDAEITWVGDLDYSTGGISNDTINGFDLILCDLTTANSNVLYQAGRAESLDKPIIYFMSNDYLTPITLMHERILFYSNASIDDEFKNELNELISLAKEHPSDFLNDSPKKATKPKAFISYSHQNKAYLDRLMVHLKPLTKSGIVDVWVDTKIKAGDKWEEEIESALTNASIAILLISADFMASDFIIENELSPLLSKAEVKGTRILPVILTPCRFSREPTLNRFQAANSPSIPLSAITEDEREVVYDQLAHSIEQALTSA